MGAITALEPTSLQVEPGAEVSTTLRVRNGGSVVDAFTFEVLGDGADWITVDPPDLRLLPDDEDQVQVRLAPPRSSRVAAGEVPFGIKVDSTEDPQHSVVEEGTVVVGAFADVTAELVPHTSQGRRGASHELAVDNRGNDRVNAEVSAWDDDELLDFDVADPGMVVEPGRAEFTKVDVRPRDTFWRGPNKTLPFHVEVAPGAAPPVGVDGTMVQRAILPPWLPKALLALLGLALLALVLWLTVLKPSIESAASEAADEAVAEQLGGNGGGGGGDGGGGGGGGATPTPGATGTPTPGATDPPAPPEAGPFGTRLSATATEGSVEEDARLVTDGFVFEMTDVVLQNPDGNVGEVRIQRDDEVLLLVALENFRDLDYHFVTPTLFTAGERVTLQVQCDEVVPDDAGGTCTAAAYVSGAMTSSDG